MQTDKALEQQLAGMQPMVCGAGAIAAFARYAGHPAMSAHVRSLNPLFLSSERESEMLAKLKEEYRLAA